MRLLAETQKTDADVVESEVLIRLGLTSVEGSRLLPGHSLETAARAHHTAYVEREKRAGYKGQGHDNDGENGRRFVSEASTEPRLVGQLEPRTAPRRTAVRAQGEEPVALGILVAALGGVHETRDQPQGH
jgi:hypothetical protein